MRAPLCCETELCPEDKGLGTESESTCEIQAIEKSFEKCHTNKTAVFGICLDNLMGTTPQVAPQIPFILSRLCRYIEEHGLHCKHLFLEGEEKNVVESLKIDFIESGDAPLEAVGNVASVAELLVLFFKELPEPLIPVSAQNDYIRDMENLSLNTLDYVSHLKHSVSKLPDSAYHVLKYLSRFLLRVASHKEYNGMSSDNLSVIFGPIIFRLSSDDPVILMNARNVVNYFVQNYHAIFEGDEKNMPFDDTTLQTPFSTIPDANPRRQIPCPSSVMPVMSLKPLSVVIPSVESNITNNNNKIKKNVPILLIERQPDDLVKSSDGKPCNVDDVPKDTITRKRKERRSSGDDTQPRSSSEERPAPTSLISLEMDFIRRCSSHEEMKKGTAAAEANMEPFVPRNIPKSGTHNLNSYASDSSDLVLNIKNHSPHPPNAKRREMESNVQQSNLNFMAVPWLSTNQFGVSENSNLVSVDASADIGLSCHFNSRQNSIAELEGKNSMECDNSEDIGNENANTSSATDNEDFLDSQRSRIPRSASCPVPTVENNSEEETSSLSLSWSMLFEPSDSEPVRSEHRYSWPLTKEAQEDAALLSPSVQSLRKSNYNEAPLSPSAYRSYLSYRSHHLDPSVPPSPPVEQEDFVKTLGESSAVSDSIKQLSKKIHGMKKKIRKFDEKFEAEFGYKPSHAEKANNPEAKKLMNDLHKARKELKALKEESHLEQVSPATWHPSKCSHILEDTTNHVNKDITKEKLKPSVEESFGVALKTLHEERKNSNRPDLVEAMTTQQVKEEKFAIQKALLEFESVHGKPSSKQERNTIRPLYDRYRSVKKLLVRSGSYPGALSKNKDVCTELQPILEHETMDFTPKVPEKRSEMEVTVGSGLSEANSSSEAVNKSTFNLDDVKGISGSNILATKYDNSNFHELPLSEMIFQLQQVKSQKRHLRKILREFESEFLRLNGRKVQKEDKAPVDALYGEYKHVKARLKLLEALISKHDQHQLM